MKDIAKQLNKCSGFYLGKLALKSNSPLALQNTLHVLLKTPCLNDVAITLDLGNVIIIIYCTSSK